MIEAGIKPKVVITQPVHAEVIALLAKHCAITANCGRAAWPRAELIDKSGPADALLVFMPDVIDEEFLRHCPKLKIVAAALKGFDNFDVQAMSRRGIWFTIVPDLLTIPTAELAISLLLCLTRRVLEGDRFVRSGNFSGWRPELYGAGLSGGTLGVIGMGAIGQHIVRRLAGFDIHIVYHDPCPLKPAQEVEWSLTAVPLEQLLRQSDFVILAAPLLESNFHLINDARLSAMKTGSYLVNVGRGSVVDEAAVARALASAKLAGYAADVFELEDLQRGDRPESIPQWLLDHPAQTLLTPHLGSAVAAVRREIELRAAHNILQALDGNVPDDAVNQPLRAHPVAERL